jgi:hypothetical protein
MAEIIDITTPWEGRTGREVESFIKGSLNGKFGAIHIDPSTWTFYFFKDEEDKQKFLDGDTSVWYKSEGLDVSKKMQQVKIINDMESTILYFTTQEEQSVITVGFISQEKNFGDENYTEVYENAYFTVEVDKSNTGSYVTVVENKRVINGEKLSVDVKNYLATGQNKVRITCTGEQSGKRDTILFTANVTTMYLKASNFGWHLPFIEGNQYKLGGMLIGGSIDKVLNIRISNENNYAASYKVPLGTATHTINPYDYYGLPFPTEGGTGVYHIELWLDADGLESDHLKYNIMCVAAADQHTAQLAVMNSSLSKIVNYAENTVFEYSCYNAGGTTATPHLKLQSIIGTVPTVLVEGALGTVETSKAQSYTYQPEIESWEEGMQLQAILTNGNEQTIIFPIDNSLSYPAISGASFYLQPSSRNNTQDDREMIINKADHSYWQAYWENMAWKDGIDGWTTDASGVKCLFLPAGSTAEVQMQPMKTLTNKTIDLVFKVDHVADYDTPVFSICDDPSSDNFNGIVVYANRVVVYTNDQKSTLVQSRNFREGVKQSMQIVYANNYKGVGNTVTIYQNGVAQCEFQYETKDLVTNNGYLKMGNAFSDFYLYSMRVYERALAWPDCVQNWIASLRTTEEKQAAMELIMKCVDDSFNMSFDAVVAAGFDYMTIEMTEGKIPSYVSQSAGKCNVELKVKGWWDVVTKFLNIDIDGQGTTAMNYWLWNLRLKLAILAFFAGRWTGKINYASGMQSHKMGATGAYDELYHAVGLENEVNGPVAVKQQPVFAFEKKLVDASADLYSYDFIGFYTFGPDKGNDAYFKLDDERFADKVIYLEGMDHNVKGAGYDYPYFKLAYKASAEAICNNGGEAALEVRKCGNAKTEAEIQAKLDEKFKPLYELAYSNNPLIKGTDATLEQMNADVEAWGKQSDAEGHKFERFEFWIDGEYDVLYLDKAENKYKSNGTNLLTQLGLTEEALAGLTIEEKNKVFIDARVAKFKASAADYLSVKDYMFKMVFCVIFFASDNGIKNTYSYILAEIWRQFQDDLDSIMKSDNQSLFSKEFWQEMFDFANENKSSYAFKGEHNVLEQLLRRAFPEVEQEMAHKILDAMVSLSPYGDNTIDKLMGYIQSRFWDKAQGYFPKSAYNNFTALAYEGAWPAYIGKSTVSYTVDVNPLSQVVGDSLETEMDFMYFRLIYIMSKYAYGPFANYDDKCLGQITWRTQASQSLTLTPAFPLYPAALSGQTGKRNADRRYMAGESITFDGLGGSNTNVYIAAADCLADVGDLSNIIVDSETDATLQISAKRLKTLKVGDEVEASSNIGRLMLTSTPSLEILDARNLKNLASDVDLSNSPRLREALLSGSVSTGVSLKRGQKIKVLSLPATITSLELLDLPNLADENLTIEGVSNVTFLRLENCKSVDMFELLKTIYKTEGNKLTNIRIVGFVYDGTAEDLDMLAHFADDTDADGNERVYNGIDADGKTDTLNIPVIEGVLNLDGYVYEETANVVRANYPNLVFQPLGYYVAIEDPEVLRVLMEKITTDDGIGVTTEDIEGVTTISTWFKGNTEIETFDELYRFIGLSSFNAAAFRNCTSLKSVSIPPQITSTSINQFNGCTSLTEVKTQTLLKIIESGTFYGCSEFEGVDLSELEELRNASAGVGVFFGTKIKEFNAPKLKTLGTTLYTAHFQGTPLERVISMGEVEVLPDGDENYGVFNKCQSLVEVNLPPTLKTIGAYCFNECSALETINIPTSVTKLGNGVFRKCSLLYLDEVNLPNLTTFGSDVFAYVKIRKLNLGKVTTLPTAGISSQNYGDKSVLEEVVIPEGVTSIPNASFYGYALVRTTIPKSVATIGAQAFYGCKALEGEVDVPNATKVDYGAFYNSAITSFNGESVTTINGGNGGDSGAFSTCKSLKSVSIPSAASIGPKAFNNCSALESIELPSVVTVSYGAFIGCSAIKSIDIGALVTMIDYQAFGSSKAAETIICRATTPPTIKTPDPLPSNTCPIFVPAASITAYAGATNWSAYADRLAPLEDHEDGGYVPIADPAVLAICVANWDANASGYMSKNEVEAVTGIANAFYKNTEIEYFNEFENFTGVTYLVNSNASASIKHCFYGCTNLKEITLPSSLTTINNGTESGQSGAFFGCTSLTKVEGMEHLVSIGRYAFRGCTSLAQDINLPNAEGTLGMLAFYQTAITKIVDLGKITILDGQSTASVNSPQGPFARCASLVEAHLPATLTEIRKGAFGFCTALTTLIIDAVTPPTLDANAWYGSNALANIYVPDASVDAYKAASGWSDASVVNLIKPMSQYNG